MPDINNPVRVFLLAHGDDDDEDAVMSDVLSDANILRN